MELALVVSVALIGLFWCGWAAAVMVIEALDAGHPAHEPERAARQALWEAQEGSVDAPNPPE